MTPVFRSCAALLLCAMPCYVLCCVSCYVYIHTQALQRVPLFAGLDPKTKGGIASALGQVSMPKGTAVVTQVGAVISV